MLTRSRKYWWKNNKKNYLSLRLDDKLELPVTIVHTILFHWLRHPTVDATQTILTLLDVQLHQALIHQVATMLPPVMLFLHACIQVFYEVRDGTAFHRRITLEGDALASTWIEDGEGTDVGMVTTLLRTNVWIILILHVRLILADKG